MSPKAQLPKPESGHKPPTRGQTTGLCQQYAKLLKSLSIGQSILTPNERHHQQGARTGMQLAKGHSIAQEAPQFTSRTIELPYSIRIWRIK